MIALLILAMAGAAISVELTVVHHRAFAQQSSGCDISKTISCSALAMKPEAVLLNVPVSVWGLAAYLAFALLALWGLFRSEHNGWPWGITFWAASSSVAYSVYLAYVAYGKYRLVCVWCTALYAVNLVVWGLSMVALKTQKRGIADGTRQDLSVVARRWKLAVPAAVVGLGLAVGLVTCYPQPKIRYAKAKMDLTGKIRPAHPARPPNPRAAGPDGGTATRPGPVRPARPGLVIPRVGKYSLLVKHTPFKGAEKPDVVVLELSDYECPFCAAAHRNVMKALKKYKSRLRLYHRHFPLDNKCNRALSEPFHKNACNAALAAICARKQGKFWAMHDLLFKNSRSHHTAGLVRLAQKVGLDIISFRACLGRADTMRELKEDIELAIALKVDATPTFVFFGARVDKIIVSGMIGVEHFDKLFKAVDKGAGRK